ncbi:MAG: nitroreductase [Spirochaetes bacterium]|jgi:nitroreductase|nr:nitroreductase [Spirochaetota bacterium]
MALLPEIDKRASARSFTDEAVSEGQLTRILEAGRVAPSAKNRQAWRFVVIQRPDMRRRVQEAAFGQEYVGQAPAVIALCTTNVEYKMPNGQLSYPVDLGIACSFMMLQAVHEDLGTCVVTTFEEQDVKSLLTVPYQMRVVMLLAVGHPADPAARADRLPLDRVVSYDHW